MNYTLCDFMPVVFERSAALFGDHRTEIDSQKMYKFMAIVNRREYNKIMKKNKRNNFFRKLFGFGNLNMAKYV